MPPKRKPKLSVVPSEHKTRRPRVQSKAQAQVVVETQEDGLFTSHLDFHQKPEVKKKSKGKQPPKPLKYQEEVEKVSSDEEGAGIIDAPEPNRTDEEALRKLQQQFDSIDDVSVWYYNTHGARLEVDKDRHVVGLHKVQPEEEKRPAAVEELVGNHPPTPKNKVKKKKKVVEPVDTVSKPLKAKDPIRDEGPMQSFVRTILENNLHITAKHLPRPSVAANRTFRVFATPVRQKIYATHIVPVERKQSSLFSQTPIRGTALLSPHAARLSTLSEFSPRSPQFASTPLEKPKKGWLPERVPVFDLSEIENVEEDKDVREDSTPVKTAVESNLVVEKTQCSSKSNSFSGNSEKQDEPMEHDEVFDSQLVADKTAVDPSQNGTFRKAETSMTEVLVDSEADEQDEHEASSYSKKRQRTKSPDPETMCQGVSTMMSVEPEEKENYGARRTTLQPQQQQLLRESRLSVMTTGSSRRVSIDSMMQDMSIDMGMETMGASRAESEGTTRVESRTLATVMTMHIDDTGMMPWYLEDASFTEMPTHIEQLYFVCGNQGTAWKWDALPKGAFTGRQVKKLGEGSYGEVFATKWDKRDVAIKIVPFEIDDDNRMYHGEYHSDKMQVAADVLPELVVMSELSKLRDLDQQNSTPNFIEVIDAKVVEGLYPKGLLKAWDVFNEKDPENFPRSENTRPDVYASEHQKFMVFVTENGGIALEDFQLESEHELRSIVIQLMLSMQAAEHMLEFEHRDLHLGNVLVKRSKDVETLHYKIYGHNINLNAHGVKVNIIDFTLSRIHKNPVTVFVDLEKDPSIFEGKGHPQFDVYREMREFRENEWYTFEKKTNLMWVEYLALQMIEEPICPKGIISEERRQELGDLFRSFKLYESCADTFTKEHFFDKFYKGYM